MIVTFGEILLKLSTPGFQRITQASSFDAQYGGSEANVAIALANFGSKARHVTAVPINDLGLSVIQTLRRYNVDTSYILETEDRLGIYFVEAGASVRGGKVIYDRANSSITLLKPGTFDWEKIFEKSTWFHWSGITPALSPNTADICMEALKVARSKNLTISADLNYRSNLWKYGKNPTDVMPALVQYCDVLLADATACEIMLGLKAPSNQQGKELYEFISEKLINTFSGLKKVILSHRTSFGASHNIYSAFLRSWDQFVEGTSHNLSPIIDRIGTGDALMAGLIFGFDQGWDDERTLNFGLASAALKHTVPGDFNQVTCDEVEKLMNGDASGRIAR